MSTPLKWHASSGSLMVWLALLIIMSGCGGSHGPSIEEEYRPTPGDALVMTAHREGVLAYEAQYRWAEMPEAESGSGGQDEMSIFALLEQEIHHVPSFRSVAPPKDPVTREELRTFLRDHWDEYSAGTADKGWNLEDFVGFLHRHGVCWEDFFDQWEEHRAAGGTLAQLVQQISDSPEPASQETPFAICDVPDTPGGLPPIPVGPPRIVGPFLVTASRFPIYNPVFRTGTGLGTGILNWKDPLLFDYIELPDIPPAYLPEIVVTWKAHGLRRFTTRVGFRPKITYKCPQYSRATGLNLPGYYVKWLTVDFGTTFRVPLTVLPIWSGSVTNLRNAGPASMPNPQGELVVDAGFVWLWQHFNRAFRFPFTGEKGFIKSG